MDDEEKVDVTPDEAEDMAEDPGETVEEAREEERYDANAGRLDDVLSRIDEISSKLDSVLEAVTAFNAVNIDNGEVLDDATEDGPDVEVADVETDNPYERDYTFDDDETRY